MLPTVFTVVFLFILIMVIIWLILENKTEIQEEFKMLVNFTVAYAKYFFVYIPNTFKILWTSFKIKYGKFYSTADEMFAKVFNDNLKVIKQKKTYAVNEYADLTQLGFIMRNCFGFYHKKDHYRCIQSLPTKNIIPFEQFPVNLNYMHLFPNHAYFQGNVESCYAFAAIGLLEAVLYKYALQNGGQHIQLSVQEILDRSFSFGNNGEKGGHMVSALEYIALMGVHKADRYKYRFGNNILDYVLEICSIGSNEPKQSIHEYHCLRSGASDEELMTALMMYGPLCVGIYSDWQGFKSYNGTQVITKEYAPSGKPDHAVILVGWDYDPQTQQHCWIIRNSYGPDWGRDGYCFIEMGANLLGINDHVSFITLDGHLDDLNRKVEPMEVDELKVPNFSQSIRYLVS